VPHAGESSGPQAIWDAIDTLGAERIGHGIAAAQDPALMQVLVDRDISLEVCPTSNVCTRSVASLAAHPLPTLVEAGVTVTINTDDPPMFATNLINEYVIAADLLDLDVTGVADLARTAARVSFLPDADKATLVAEIDAYEAAWPAG
jgi:aminodeoxyfutalosine deaminase